MWRAAQLLPGLGTSPETPRSCPPRVRGRRSGVPWFCVRSRALRRCAMRGRLRCSSSLLLGQRLIGCSGSVAPRCIRPSKLNDRNDSYRAKASNPAITLRHCKPLCRTSVRRTVLGRSRRQVGQVLAGPGVLLLGRIVRLGPGGNDALGSGATVRTVLAGEIFVVDRLHGGADSIWAVSALWERQIYGGEEIGVRQVQVPGRMLEWPIRRCTTWTSSPRRTRLVA